MVCFFNITISRFQRCYFRDQQEIAQQVKTRTIKQESLSQPPMTHMVGET